MKRLYLTVEGQTEQAFAVEVLQPHLAQFDVHVSKPRLTGLHARRKGRIPSGGLLNSFQHSLGDIRRWLREDKSPDARFSIMVDLYSLPKDFPGYDIASRAGNTYQRVKMLHKALAEELNDRRFIPYLQVHEFEALVLSKPEVFGDWFENVKKQVQNLAADCQTFNTPEEINDGQHTHPKARIKKFIPEYDENVDGPVLTAGIGLEAIRKACQHFNEWLTILEQSNE